MATPDDIPSDLTLEITGDLSPERFMAAARAFFGYVQEVGRGVSTSGADWVVRVKEGSNLIGIDPGPAAQIVVVRNVYKAIHAGIGKLVAGDLVDAQIPDAALRHMRSLSDLGQKSKGAPITIKLWVEKKPTTLGRKIAAVIQEDWRADYRDFGTIEGDLETIQDRGNLQIRVRDKLVGQSIQCVIPEKMLNEVFGCFRKRVEVYGIIHYRRNGTPISIEVERIETLPDDIDLPTPTDVRGILRNTEWPLI